MSTTTVTLVTPLQQLGRRDAKSSAIATSSANEPACIFSSPAYFILVYTTWSYFVFRCKVKIGQGYH